MYMTPRPPLAKNRIPATGSIAKPSGIESKTTEVIVNDILCVSYQKPQKADVEFELNNV